MNLDSIFSVKNDRLGLLNEHTAVDFFKKLLWAEARILGIEISKIHVSSAIHISDGGVDASVDDAQTATSAGIIKPGKTSYQIKSGASFKPWQKSDIKTTLFGTKTPDRKHLGESIHACFDSGGTYILVCTGIDLDESRRRNILKYIRKYVKLCDYADAKVEVWSQSDLIGFIEFFPSLALQLNGYGGAHFQTHESWRQNDEMQVEFVQGQSQKDLITKIRNELRRNDDTVHVRVLGEPGIGKTKLVFEATKTEDLSPLVIYCSASQFRDSALMNALLRDDNHFSAILVVDECDADSRFYIWDRLRHRGPRIKLISIYNDYDPISGGGISEFETLPLDNEQIHTIFQKYETSKDQDRRYIELCSGSPRMAHHIGRTLESYPGDPSQLLTDDYLYRSFYIDFGREDPNSQEIQHRKLVLQYIALFKKFGFERSVMADAQAIAKKVEEANPQITWSRFQELVDALRQRKTLQGDFTLYLTPKVLHIKLWTEWWRVRGDSFDLEEFVQELPPKLVEWFYDMFVYAAESETASAIVKNLLSPHGPFQDGAYLKTELGSRFFLALTEADPKSALKCLMGTIGAWDRATLLEFKEGRREVVLALEKIAVWRELFADAARLLLALGEAENEGFSNNASNTFAGLFTLAPGRVASTEATPAQRLRILENAFDSGTKERRTLALKACNIALQSEFFSRIGSREHEGLPKEPELWTPKTYDELWGAYRRVWKLLDDQLANLPDDERKRGTTILFEHAREISRIPSLDEMVVNTVTTIAEKTYVNEKQIIETISQVLQYARDDLPTEIRERWEQLMAELVPPDFHSMMQRYVGMELLEDFQPDEEQNYVDQAIPRIETLAAQAAANPYLLKSELDWLVTSEAKKGYQFGQELGKQDEKFSLLSTLLDAQRSADRNASTAFLGGYFRAILDSNPALWETKLDALIDDTQLNRLIPELTSRTGLTDRSARRILNLAKKGVITIDDLKNFTYAEAIKNLSEEIFTEWLAFLMGSTDKTGVSIALNLYHHYYDIQKPDLTLLPFEQTFQLLSHPSLFEKSDTSRFDVMVEYHWTEIAKVFLKRYPDKRLKLAELMLSHFGEDGTIVSVRSQTCLILDYIAEDCPSEVWEQVGRLLATPTHSSRTIALEQWLGEGCSAGRKKSQAALTYIPPARIWQWIDADVENRARYFAHRLVPKTYVSEAWNTSLARAVLVRYGDHEEVQSGLMSNYLSEVWHGPPSVHYQQKQETLLQLRENEDDKNVQRWIDKFVEGLEEAIKNEKTREEREH